MANLQSINSGNSYPDFSGMQSRISKLNPYFSDNYAPTFPGYSDNPPSYVTGQTSSAVPDLTEDQKRFLAFKQAELPFTIDAINQLSQNQADLNYQQMLKSMGPINWAAKEASDRSIKGTNAVRLATDLLPSAKQNRMLESNSAFSEAALATAAQQDAAARLAATNFARTYARG